MRSVPAAVTVCLLLVLAGCASPMGPSSGEVTDTPTSSSVESTTTNLPPTDSSPQTQTPQTVPKSRTATATSVPTRSPEPTTSIQSEPPVVDDGDRPEPVEQFPVPDGAVPTYAPDPDPPLSPDTMIQAFDHPDDPEFVTEWYRTELEGWTLRSWTDEYNPAYGWLNRQLFTSQGEAMLVLVSSGQNGSEILVSRGEGIVGVRPWFVFPEIGFGPRTFVESPVRPAVISSITPLGNLAPPGHTFPTDHSYLAIDDEDRPAPVVAPADGIIVSVTKTDLSDPPVEDYSLRIRHSNTFETKFGHMSSLDPSLLEAIGGIDDGTKTVRVPVEAGDPLGTAAMEYSTSLDWWVVDEEHHNTGFIHPEYYGTGVHAVSFLDHSSPDLRATFEERLFRSTPPYGGTIDYDRPGRLVGNWFLEGDAIRPRDGSHHLAFVYAVHDATRLRVALGGVLADPGQYAVAGNDPDPATVTAEDGPIVYHLRRATGTGEVRAEPAATILVEVLDGHRIKVEGFDGHVDDPTFTEDARFYVR